VEPQQAYQLSAFDFSDLKGSASHADTIKEEKPELKELYFSYAKPEAPKTHTVKPGENLSVIAQQYATSYQALAKLNRIKAPYIIYPEQVLLIELPDNSAIKETKLQGYHIPLGTKLNIIASGSPNTLTTIEVQADGHPFPVLKDGREVTRFDVMLDKNGQSVTEVLLRPASDDKYRQLIDTYAPQVGQGEKRSRLTLMGEIHQSGYMSSLKNDDMNTIGLNLFQLYIKNAYVINPDTGKVYAQLKARQQGNEIVFIDTETDEPVAKTTLDKLVNGIGTINNGFGGLATGMEQYEGTFAIKNRFYCCKTCCTKCFSQLIFQSLQNTGLPTRKPL